MKTWDLRERELSRRNIIDSNVWYNRPKNQFSWLVVVSNEMEINFLPWLSYLNNILQLAQEASKWTTTM